MNEERLNDLEKRLEKTLEVQKALQNAFNTQEVQDIIDEETYEDTDENDDSCIGEEY